MRDLGRTYVQWQKQWPSSDMIVDIIVLLWGSGSIVYGTTLAVAAGARGSCGRGGSSDLLTNEPYGLCLVSRVYRWCRLFVCWWTPQAQKKSKRCLRFGAMVVLSIASFPLTLFHGVVSKLQALTVKYWR